MTFEKRGAKKGRHPSSAGRNRVRREESSWLEGGKSFAAGAGIFFPTSLSFAARRGIGRNSTRFFSPAWLAKAGGSFFPFFERRRRVPSSLLLLIHHKFTLSLVAQHQVVGSLTGLILTGEGGREEKETTGGGRQSLIIREKKGRREGKGKVRLVGGGHHQGSTKEKNILPLSPRTYLVAWEGG